MILLGHTLVNMYKFAKMDERINQKPIMKKNYDTWYPALDARGRNILMQQYFYPIGTAATNNTKELD